MSDFYNPENKIAFLESREIASKESYARVLKLSAEAEKSLGVDLYDFSLEQIKEVLLNQKYSSRTTVLSIISIMRNYINWAIENGKRTNPENPLEHINNNDEAFFAEVVNDTKKIFFSEDELTFIEDTVSPNPQDSVILRLIFEGVGGKNFSELINLKYTDLNKNNNTLLLTNEEGEQRTIKISYRLIVMIDRAFEQEKYITDARWGESPKAELVPSPYVIKKIKLRKSNESDLRVKSYVIRKRLERYRDKGFTFLMRKKIQKSGMLYMAKELFQREGKLEKEQWDLIAKQFGFKLFTQEKGVQYYALNAYKQSINIDKIKEVYDPTKTLEHLLK
ncbi:phage lytic cycle repressor MrpR family protein [Shouchella clausii]|uniref:phage lytic cycle repressor MrpR family protein n=1 Tax=Shouchella clausii TaxID=79880 RepID=UPI001C732BE3|nr:hypothetical protein [Shouchella clausii]MBX0320120.1 hypothetical protein [Shouchella clausii]MEB5480868.1 hypothetical protein [Shouchella clausii]